jgi:L-ascorbate metabolism protein UlaG (beta-lactamase superfamily)
MNPARAAESLGLLRPRIAIPIHWGTYFPWHLGLRRPPGWLDTPPLTFKDAAAAVAPDVDVRILRPGESTTI